MKALHVRSRRRGSAVRVVLAVLASVAILGVIWASTRGVSPTATPGGRESLTVFCAASNQPVFEAIRQEYEQAYGVDIRVQYGPSETLLASVDVSKSGDLYLPADDSFLESARQRGLAAEVFPLAGMQAVVAVPKGNPKQIQKWEDLLQAGLRVAQGATESTAIGKLTRQALSKSGLWDALHKHTSVYKTTVNEVASDVKVGSVDAGIVFDAVLTNFNTLEAIKLPELKEAHANIAAAVLTTSQQPTRALHFARYLSARDKGLVKYREFGFEPTEGDVWSEKPELTLYAGSMLRPAIEATITAFEEREGTRVTRVYNGCGILVAQMKAGQAPDAYFACDLEFMKQVSDIFPVSEAISQNELVIVVQKGNPHGIASLRDLSKPGLRVGIGHEKQCAMGWLTQRTFNEGGVQAEIMKNVVVQTPTGDMLVNQMRSGSLDAAVAYLTNVAGAAHDLDAVRIQGLKCSVATQPYGIAQETAHRRSMERLLAAIRAAKSQERFSQEGFRWAPPQQDAHE